MSKEQEYYEEIERRVREVYQQAYEEVSEKCERYFDLFTEQDRIWRRRLANREVTREQYQEWYRNKVFVGERWKAVRDSMAETLVNADNVARSIITGYIPEAYAYGMNLAAYQIEQLVGLSSSFTLYNAEAVEILIRDYPSLLPQLQPESETARAIREGRAFAWNQQHITSAITQGIIQGEALPRIAERLQNVVGMDERAAQRNARTAMTAARNAGHLASYQRAERMGIQLDEMWLAIPDERTRHSHRLMNGVRVPVGEPFVLEDGVRLRFPADPNGTSSDVNVNVGSYIYNCRCRIIGVPRGMPLDMNDIQPEHIGNMTYEEWLNDRTGGRSNGRSNSQSRRRQSRRNTQSQRRADTRSS